MLKSACASLVSALALCGFMNAASAGISAEEAARLGADLTPLGGEKAGNAAGTIPAWDGGLSSAEKAGFPGYKTGSHHPDPFANEKPLFTINAQNALQYANNLTEGHKALLRAYKDTYFMNVYPSHRTAAHPQRMYDATKRIATTAIRSVETLSGRRAPASISRRSVARKLRWKR
jgi:hypothetical protein